MKVENCQGRLEVKQDPEPGLTVEVSRSAFSSQSVESTQVGWARQVELDLRHRQTRVTGNRHWRRVECFSGVYTRGDRMQVEPEGHAQQHTQRARESN